MPRSRWPPIQTWTAHQHGCHLLFAPPATSEGLPARPVNPSHHGLPRSGGHQRRERRLVGALALSLPHFSPGAGITERDAIVPGPIVPDCVVEGLRVGFVEGPASQVALAFQNLLKSLHSRRGNAKPLQSKGPKSRNSPVKSDCQQQTSRKQSPTASHDTVKAGSWPFSLH